MSKLKKAAELSFKQWVDEIEKEYKAALEKGEIPQKTKEEMRQEANRIWELAHKKEK